MRVDHACACVPCRERDVLEKAERWKASWRGSLGDTYDTANELSRAIADLRAARRRAQRQERKAGG